MRNFIEIDHVGYAVKDIMATARLYVESGWQLSELYEEKVQNAKIAFLRRPGFVTIELVAPLNGESPVDKFLETGGVQPYHICYVVDDVMKAVEDLHNENFMPLFWPVESVAMSNRKICYLYNENVGLIEIVNK